METGLYKTGRFKKKEHIKRPGEIQNLFKQGKRYSTSGAKLFVLDNTNQTNRVVFAIPKNYGTAVQRNYSKRLSREIYRYFKMYLNTGYDLLLLVYPGNDSFRTRYIQFRYLCQKAGLLKEGISL